MQLTKLPYAKRLKHGLLASSIVALGALHTPAWADDDLSYTFLDLEYVDTELDDGPDLSGDGFGASGSVAIGKHMFLSAGYLDQEFDDNVDAEQRALGLGLHAPLGDGLDLIGQVSYVDVELDTPFGDAEDDGYGVGVGLRGRLGDAFELEGMLNYLDLDDSGDNTSVSLGARYYVRQGFAFGIGADLTDDATTWRAGIRFEF